MYPSGKKNILVTGGAGFIGSHLCDELVKDNHVICLDNFCGGSIRNIEHLLQRPNFRFIKHDINQSIDLEGLPELKDFKIKFQGIQEIYHLACPTSAKNFMRLRLETLKTNVLGTINVLEIAKKYKAKILFASSAVVYGPRQEKNPYFKETDFGYVNFISPRACYDEGKRFAETCFITYQEMFGLEIKIARIFRTYGPRMPLFDGQMIADFVLQALNNRSLIVYGHENFVTSLCYVGDIVEGLKLFMASEVVGPVNFGYPGEYKLVDVAQKIIQLTGSQSEVVFRPPLLFMTMQGLPDISLAREKLNWFPVVGLEAGLKETIEDVKIKRMLLEPFLIEYDKELK